MGRNSQRSGFYVIDHILKDLFNRVTLVSSESSPVLSSLGDYFRNQKFRFALILERKFPMLIAKHQCDNIQSLDAGSEIGVLVEYVPLLSKKAIEWVSPYTPS